MPLKLDITNERYGRLVAINFVRAHKGISWWLFKCDCGKEKVLSINNVRRGTTFSCGCAGIERSIKLGKKCGRINGIKNARKDSGFNTMYSHYALGAKRRDLVFDITKEDFRRLTSLNCFYCGKEPSSISRRISKIGDYIYNGLDRIDNFKGYTLDNVTPCCFVCNRLKSSLNQENFLNQIKKIHAHLKLVQ